MHHRVTFENYDQTVPMRGLIWTHHENIPRYNFDTLQPPFYMVKLGFKKSQLFNAVSLTSSLFHFVNYFSGFNKQYSDFFFFLKKKKKKKNLSSFCTE